MDTVGLSEADTVPQALLELVDEAVAGTLIVFTEGVAPPVEVNEPVPLREPVLVDEPLPDTETVCVTERDTPGLLDAVGGPEPLFDPEAHIV